MSQFVSAATRILIHLRLARLLLLRSRMLRVAPLVLVAGCLYIGTRNLPPTITLDASTTSTIKGAPVTVNAHLQDDQDGVDQLHVDIQVVDELGAPTDACTVESVGGGHGKRFTFYRIGTYRVTGHVADHLGAASDAVPLSIVVTDAAPVFSRGAAIVPSTQPSSCRSYTAGEPVVLRLDGAVSDADADAEASPECHTAETLSYSWRIVDGPTGNGARLTPFTAAGCVDPGPLSSPMLAVPDAAARVCLWTDAAVAPALKSTYLVRFVVADQTSPEIQGPMLSVDVAPDQPPCITGEAPAAGAYVVDRTQPLWLEVTGVADDRDPYGSSQLGFVWSIWRQSDPTWRDVPAHAEPMFELDPSGFGVGELVRLRVEAVDRTGARASTSDCDPSLDDCTVTSCAVASPQLCHKWRTWDLELR
jgi:hypothetical protein